MENVSEVRVVSCSESDFIKPFRLRYKQNGIPKLWDVVEIHDSVSIILFNVSRNVLVLVKQYRPAVHFGSVPAKERLDAIDIHQHPGSNGITLELCAGIVDKDVPLEEIARQEILEECGYDVSASALEKVVQCRGAVGVSGDRQSMFYTEVTDQMKVTEGGGKVSEGEFIQVVEMGIKEARKFLDDGNVASPAGLLYGISWFLTNKAGKFKNLHGAV